ncbi:MAG: putative bifunctional diguanylate cyclase/phosphodiesterase [Nitrospirota bacterium]
MSTSEQSILLAGGPPEALPLLEKALQASVPHATIARSHGLDEALKRIAEARYDLFFVDAAHANGGLRQLMSRIRNRGIEAPAVVVTGVDNDDAGAAVIREGAQDYLVRGRFDHELVSRTVRHITECRFLAAAVALSEARYQRLLDSITDYTYSVAIENSKAAASKHGPGCAAVTGYRSDEFDADPYLWYRMVHDADRPAVLEMAAQIIEGKTPPPLEHRIIHRDGSVRWIKNTPVPHYDQQGRLISYDGLVSDITERKQAEQKLSHASYYDSLTDLPNRELFRDRLRQALIQARRHGRMLAVMVLDLDRFKGINETLGHTMGDILLQAVAKRLMRCIREDDTVARPGGDEFIILFADMAEAQDASLVARKIQQALIKSFSLGGREYFITTSIGISLYPAHGADVDTLIKNADAALYQAKARGRNNHQFYIEAMHTGADKKLFLENSLRSAIDREEFTLHYQPLVDLVSGRTTGAEALVRWQHPELGLLSPLEFIPLAEETGLIIPLGDWILQKACMQARHWRDAGFSPLRVSVNLSMRQFTQNAVTDTVLRAISGAQLNPGLLELELTESMVMNDAETTIASLRELKAIGVHLSLDDFGTGYSSLSRLKDLPLSTLKLDQSFVSAITRDKSNAAISRAIIGLSHNLDLRVIAEGVETTDQLEFLRGLECDGVQGYLFSRPLPAAEMTAFMQNHVC